jgi:membrane fusion protein (multidrug efflux system)
MAEIKDLEPGKSINGQRKKALRLFGLVFLCAVLVGAGCWWLFSRNRISTDDAYVAADSSVVSSRIPASISEVKVDNDEMVSAGDVLVELDPNDYKAVVDKCKATISRMEQEIQVSELKIQLTETQTTAQVRAGQALTHADENKEVEGRHQIEELERLKAGAQADFAHAKRDLERYTNLYEQGAGSEQQVDKTTTAYKKAKAQFDAMDSKIAASRASLAAVLQNVHRARAQLDNAVADRLRVDMEKHTLAALKAKLAEAQAELRTAELNLSYCTIRAPISGYIAQKHIQIGERVLPGQGLLAVVPLQEVYVEANFKETQLKDLRIGQPAEIESDLYPGHIYRGKVVGIRAGTGAAFSLLPPENATGNWIKVVQRIPVQIRLDKPPPPEFPLRVGSSLDVTVTTSVKSGSRLARERSDRQG